MTIEFDHTQQRENRVEENEWTLPTDITLLDTAVNSFTATLVSAGWEKESEELDHAQNGFRELLSNAIAHGNLKVEIPEGSEETLYDIALREQQLHPEKKQKKVFVHIKASKKEVIMTIRDEGEGFAPEKVPNPLLPKNLMKTSGRGLFYMKSFFGFKSVDYNFSKGGTEVTAVKSLE